MEDLIIIVYGFDFNNSNNPNALCLNDLISIFRTQFNVHILTTTTDLNECKNLVDNVQVHYIPIKFKENGKLNFDNWEAKVLLLFEKIKLTKTKPRLLTISFPFNILQIGLKIKNKFPEVPWTVYELDPYAYNLVLRIPHLAFIYRHFLERRIFVKCDQLLLTHELYNQYSNNIFSKFNKKFADVGIPILKINQGSEVDKKNDDISIVYIGSFYKNIREPKYMFDVISKLIEINKKVYFHIYGPSLQEIPNDLMEKYKKNIFVYGRVKKEKIHEVIDGSDILVNLGNSVENQLPSKVLEYIGTGKPIVNFYRISKDTSNSYLKRYPLSCLINENEKEIFRNVKKINEFILENQGKKVSEKIINEIYIEDKIEIVASKIISKIKR